MLVRRLYKILLLDVATMFIITGQMCHLKFWGVIAYKLYLSF